MIRSWSRENFYSLASLDFYKSNCLRHQISVAESICKWKEASHFKGDGFKYISFYHTNLKTGKYLLRPFSLKSVPNVVT